MNILGKIFGMSCDIDNCTETCPIMGGACDHEKVVIFAGEYDETADSVSLTVIRECTKIRGLKFYCCNGAYDRSFIKSLHKDDVHVLNIKWKDVINSGDFVKDYRLAVLHGEDAAFYEHIKVCKNRKHRTNGKISFVGCICRKNTAARGSKAAEMGDRDDDAIVPRAGQRALLRVCSIANIAHEHGAQNLDNEQLIEQLKKEREANAAKGLFISMISHEIRTPLAVIQGIADLVTQRNAITDDERRSYMQTVSKSVACVTEMIDRVLILGKVQNNQLMFQPKDGDIVEFCLNIVSEIEDMSDGRKVVVKLSKKFPRVVPFDAALLKHVISNLLSNAVKYSKRSSVVELSLVHRHGELEICVSDHGIGIPKSEQKSIFRLFNRASNVNSINGIGIGMFIVKRCVILHGGKIFLKSEEGAGSSFRVVLPIVEHDNQLCCD